MARPRKEETNSKTEETKKIPEFPPVDMTTTRRRAFNLVNQTVGMYLDTIETEGDLEIEEIAKKGYEELSAKLDVMTNAHLPQISIQLNAKMIARYLGDIVNTLNLFYDHERVYGTEAAVKDLSSTVLDTLKRLENLGEKASQSIDNSFSEFIGGQCFVVNQAWEGATRILCRDFYTRLNAVNPDW